MAKTNSELLERLDSLKAKEQVRLEIIASYAIYLVPLIPAMLSFFDIRAYITWSENIPDAFIYLFGIIAGAILEFLGLAASHTFSAFNVHNRSAGKTQKVGVFWVIVAWIFYLAVMFALNVGLPWPHITNGEKIARTGLSFLSIPVFILVSVRSTHAQILIDREKAKRKRKQEKEKSNIIATTQPVPHSNGNLSARELIEMFADQNGISVDDIGRGGIYSPSHVANVVGLNEGTVRTALSRMKN